LKIQRLQALGAISVRRCCRTRSVYINLVWTAWIFDRHNHPHLRSSTKNYNPIIMRYLIITLLALSTTVLAVPGVPAVNVKVSQVLELTYYCVHSTILIQYK
jgi:hypothetical protein